MRRKIRAVSGEMKVAKNSLVRRAIKGTAYAPLGEKLGGPVGLILTESDPVELVKTIVGFKDLGDKFKLRGAVMAGQDAYGRGDQYARDAAAQGSRDGAAPGAAERSCDATG